MCAHLHSTVHMLTCQDHWLDRTAPFIVGLPAIHEEQIYAVPVDKISGRLTLRTTGNTRAGDKFLLVDSSIVFL